MTENIETSTNDEITNEEQTNDETTTEQPTPKRISKYNNETERHNAIKAQKRQWYHLNKDKQKLKSLKAYYQNQLKKHAKIE